MTTKVRIEYICRSHGGSDGSRELPEHSSFAWILTECSKLATFVRNFIIQTSLWHLRLGCRCNYWIRCTASLTRGMDAWTEFREFLTFINFTECSHEELAVMMSKCNSKMLLQRTAGPATHQTFLHAKLIYIYSVPSYQLHWSSRTFVIMEYSKLDKWKPLTLISHRHCVGSSWKWVTF